MPPIRSTTTRNTPSNTIPQSQPNFSFPTDRHLVITTPRHVFSWDSTGVRIIFQSRSGGIIAAREAKDSSGVLAVARSNVIVMHDTKRGKEESWGLNAPNDEVRHLEYSPDAKSLFLSTTSDGTIQRYSTETSRLLDPAQKHETAPVALALSATGHLVLSASHNPPLVYMRNLSHNSPPIHIQPNASLSPVSCASFHPERPNVFLLAFRDGTIAAYDATKMPRGTDHQSTNDGEISHITSVHRAIMTGDSSLGKTAPAAPIVGAVFLPGFKTRAVTAGRDGKCKLIDFAKGGVVLRTWHAKAPLTAIAVLSVRADSAAQPQKPSVSRGRRNRSSGSHTIGGPTSTDSIIAVSRVDGGVNLYDSVGLLLTQKTITSQEEKILSLEWAKGPSPQGFRGSQEANRHFDDIEPLSIMRSTSRRQTARQVDSVSRSTRVSAPEPDTHLGLPPGLHVTSPRQFTIHPDEIEEGTVRHTPSAQPAQAVLPTGANYVYHDLFSPLKPGGQQSDNVVRPLVSSPLRSRPRISSQTFIKNSEAVAEPVNKIRKSCKSNIAASPVVKAPTQVRKPANCNYRTSFSRVGDGSMGFDEEADQNAKVLANIRRLGGHVSHRKSPRAKAAIRVKQVRREVDVHDSSTWPTDSASLSGHMSENDIWMTSDSEEDRSLHRRRRMKPITRPPARQTSRSKVDSRGTMSTFDTRGNTTQALNVTFVNADGSAEDDAFATADTHQSQMANVFPASQDVRELFPRSSSLSPGKHKPKRGPRRSLRREAALTALSVNAVMGPPPRSPWARLKAGKPAMRIYQDPSRSQPGLSSKPPDVDSPTCATCPETRARVQSLEAEVGQLKGEVLALKAVLRRSGLALPASLRHR